MKTQNACRPSSASAVRRICRDATSGPAGPAMRRPLEVDVAMEIAGDLKGRLSQIHVGIMPEETLELHIAIEG